MEKFKDEVNCLRRFVEFRIKELKARESKERLREVEEGPGPSRGEPPPSW